MSGPLDRKVLEGMKRADLQKLCKDHGIKANMKSEALVDLLLETTQPLVQRATLPQPEPKRNSSMRIVSRSTAGSRPRERSGGSVIIHEPDEEEEEQDDMIQEDNEPQQEPPAQPALLRTRKAKETQFRLGVGRPAVAGGSGARAVTKSQSVSRGKRGKGSRSVKPTEEAIQEEEEESEHIESSGSTAGPSGTSHKSDPPPHPPGPAGQPVPSTTFLPGNMPDLNTYIMDIVQPLREQIQSLQADVVLQGEDVKQLKEQVGSLTTEVSALRSEVSHATGLETEFQRLKHSMATISLSNQGEFAKALGTSRVLGTTSKSTSLLPEAIITSPQHPTVTLLGKRQRDYDESNTTDVVEGNGSSSAKVSRPTKKRPRLGSKEADPLAPAGVDTDVELGEAEAEDEMEQTVEPAPAPRIASFQIFSGEEEPPDPYIDPPPPTTRLSDLFAPALSERTPPAVDLGSGPTTATANASENAQPNALFNFTFTSSVFQPTTSTPAAPFGGIGLPTVSYPEPPTSPTPGANPSGGYIQRAGGRRERNDLFHPFGEPRRPRSAPKPRSRPPSRASQPSTAGGPSRATRSDDETVNPSRLLRTPPPKLAPLPEAESSTQAAEDDENKGEPTTPVSSSTVGMGMGMAPIPETPAVPMPRTMYGTELEGDTRFGDFGIEGVATGFWTGPGPRF